MKTFMIYTVVFLVIGALLYVFAFFRPNANRVEDLERRVAAEEQELEAAILRSENHPELHYELEKLRIILEEEEGHYLFMNQVWADRFSPFVPETFEEDSLRWSLEGMLHPNVENLQVEILFSEPLCITSDYDAGDLPRGLWMTPIQLSFSATYEDVINVLTALANTNFDNRVIGYSLERDGDRWRVVLRVDVLTETPPPGRFNGEYVTYDSEG